MANKVNCPAFTKGCVAACRSCIWNGAGPSRICIEMKKKYDIKEAKIIEQKRQNETSGRR
jgi:hypothetical protein